MARPNLMDLSVDIKTLIVKHIKRPSDLRNVCLACSQMHEIAARELYHQVSLDVGSPNDNRLAAFLSPSNIGLPHVRKLDLYLADVADKCKQTQQAHFAIRMILQLLPRDILEKFSWHSCSAFHHDNLVLLYKTQQKMKSLEGIALVRKCLDEIEKIPSLSKVFQNASKLGLYPDSRDVLEFCNFLVKNSPKMEKMTLRACFQESETAIPERELNDSSSAPGRITSTIFSHMRPFDKCTPLALRDVTLQKIHLRYAGNSYCKIINFRTVRSLKIVLCPGADSLFAELSRSTLLPDKLETLELKHNDNAENDCLEAVEHFLYLVSGIEKLTLDFSYVNSMPATASITRHRKTLKSPNVHASLGDDHSEESLYDSESFSRICMECSLLEQISVAFPTVSVLNTKRDSFLEFEYCLGNLPSLVTLNITTWPTNDPSPKKLPRQTYEQMLQGIAQQGFVRSALYAAENNRTTKLAIIAWGCSNKIYVRENSRNQMIFVKGKQVDPLGNETFAAVQMGWCLRKFLDAGPKSHVLDFSPCRSTPPPVRDGPSSEDSD